MLGVKKGGAKRDSEGRLLRYQRRVEYLGENPPCTDCGRSDRSMVIMRKDATPISQDSSTFWGRSRKYIEEHLPFMVVVCRTCQMKRQMAAGRRPKSDHGGYAMFTRGCRCARCKEYGRIVRQRQNEGRLAKRLAASKPKLTCAFCGLGETTSIYRRCTVCRPKGTVLGDRCRRHAVLPSKSGRCPGISYLGECTLSQYHAPQQ